MTAVSVYSDLYGHQPAVAEYVGSRAAVVRHTLPLAIGLMVLVRFGEPSDFAEDVATSERCSIEIAARVEPSVLEGQYCLLFQAPIRK